MELVAPAGFGKSALIRQYLQQRPGRICDCADVRDDLDLARRLMPELGAELGDGGASVAERVGRALEAWSSVTGVVAFENAQHLNSASVARGFFMRLLAGRSPGATIVIATRDDARFALMRYASPHEVVALRAFDLAFDSAEVASIFASHAPDESAIARILAVTDGWPVAVSLLLRAANERGIQMLLERLDAIAFETMRDYLIDEVMIGLDSRVLQALFACASIPFATADDIRLAFGDPTLVDDLLKFAKESPLITREAGGALRIQPLLAALLIEHQEGRRAALLRDVAAVRDAAGEYERAAQIHAARGDQHATARALAKHEALADRRLSKTYVQTLAGIDRAVVSRYPRLWGMSAMSRVFCVDTERLVDEAESIWRTLPPDVTPMERFYVLLFRTLFTSYRGSFQEALEEIDAFELTCDVATGSPALLAGYVNYLRGLLRARTGAFAATEAELNVALSIVGEIDVAAASIYLSFGADIARARGERAIERQFIERALERAHLSGFENIVALDHSEALFGAWFAGEMAAFNKAVNALEEICRRAGVTGFRSLLAAARGRRGEPSSSDAARAAIYGRLISLGAMRDAKERLRIAESALALAVRVGQPFLEALAAIALGACDDLRFDDCVTLARKAASRCESPPLLRAIDAIAKRRSDAGMLNAFVANIERGRTHAPAPIAVDVTVGRVRVDGVTVALSGRELELVLALAMRREASSRLRLAAMLWPDLDSNAARNALSVCLHRLRAHLGRGNAIVRERDGYRLHDDATVDLWEIERAAGHLRTRELLHEPDRVALERMWALLREKRPERMERWEWFEPVRRRLDALRADVSHRLGVEALERGDTAGALQFAHDAIGVDGCDEPAYEIAIRAHLKEGDRSAALRAFRTYRDALQAELACEPSETLAALVAG
ncbi:MAG TPA: BTAD domain-containing putative transcriptional regulator [Candidatus Baltobacteraceae bacterium]|nr:BTAD domain-containing putative transcriptional regulator [Candidatus Baltobacteraceae bacterium]